MKIVYNGSMDAVTFKDLLGENIPKLIEQDPDVIYLDADLMSCIGTTKYALNNPDKAINCGISEANMIGVASGLAAAGFKPIAHTFGIFASRRVFDQVFLSAGYARNDITVLGTDPGVCAAYNGGTHMPFEDVALYRAVPTATIFDIADTAQLLNVLTQAKDLPGVKYIRVGRKNNAKVYETGSEFPIGKGITVREGKDAVVFATGIMIHEAMQAAEELSKEGIEIAVIDMFTVKPIDEDCIVKYAEQTGAVVTAENHNKVGGLFSAVSEVLGRKCPTPVDYVAVEDQYGQVGPQDYLQQVYGLTKENVVKKVKAVLARKK